MRVAQVPILASSNAASDQLSAVQNLNQLFSYAVSATFTSTPAGTLTLEGSVDGTNFVTVAGSTQLINDAGTTIWNVSGCNYQYVRCRWVHTGGSAGTVIMTCFIRGF